MTPALQNLKSITGALLAPIMDYPKINEATLALHKLFSEATAFDEMETTNQSNIATKAGIALSPRWAASCVVDTLRTRNFIMGIRDAINEKLKTNPGKPVTVLYAGTGPFATLLTPLITLFSPAALQMVLLEINPASIHYLKKIIAHFNMEPYLIDLVQADAVTWCIPDNQQPDIIVSETMNNALQKEPQVSIVANLLSQCSKKPFLIPELIKVDVCLLGKKNDDAEDLFFLKTLLALNVETAVRIKNNPEDEPALSPGIIVTISELPDLHYNQLVLCTSIQIFGQHCLGFNDSGLTVPHILRMTDSIEKYPVRLLFQYHVENNPGFRVTEVSVN